MGFNNKCPLFYKKFCGCMATNVPCLKKGFQDKECAPFLSAYEVGKEYEKQRWLDKNGHSPYDKDTSEWVEDDNGAAFRSWHCKKCFDQAPVRPTEFCPNCGRYMRNWKEF